MGVASSFEEGRILARRLALCAIAAIMLGCEQPPTQRDLWRQVTADDIGTIQMKVDTLPRDKGRVKQKRSYWQEHPGLIFATTNKQDIAKCVDIMKSLAEDGRLEWNRNKKQSWPTNRLVFLAKDNDKSRYLSFYLTSAEKRFGPEFFKLLDTVGTKENTRTISVSDDHSHPSQNP